MQGEFTHLSEQPIVSQYLFFCKDTRNDSGTASDGLTIVVILCALSTLAFHMTVRFLASSPFSPLVVFGTIQRYSRPNSISTALLVSSSTKLFPILMVIWSYDVPAAAQALGWAVVANNVEALRILLDSSYTVAALLAMSGAVARWAVGRSIMITAGLHGVDSAGEASIEANGKALWALLIYAKDWAGQLATS